MSLEQTGCPNTHICLGNQNIYLINTLLFRFVFSYPKPAAVPPSDDATKPQRNRNFLPNHFNIYLDKKNNNYRCKTHCFLINYFPDVFAKIAHFYHRQPQYQGEEDVQGHQTGQVTKTEQGK